MPTPIPTTLSDVLNAVANQLVAWPAVNLTLDRIYLALDPDLVPHTTGDREILLCPGDERKDSTSEGSGRVEARVIRRLRLRLRTRMNLDEINRATSFLTGATMENGQSVTLGHFAFEDAVIDSLYLFQATDNVQNALMYKPMVYLNAGSVTKRGSDQAMGFGYSDLWFDVPYIRNLSQSFQ